MTAPRVIVVGGGVIGVSCAYALAKAGAEVRLFERDEIAAGASSGNAGTVSAGHPPLNRPGRVRQALVQMLDPTSPLYVRPRWDPELWRWLLDFARHCTAEHVQASMEVMAPLGKDALRAFDELIEEEAIDCGYQRDGYFDVCMTPAGLDKARHEASLIESFGYHPELVSGDELRRQEPAFGPDVIGGVFYPEARTLDPLRFLTGLAECARSRGVQVREGVAVTGVSIVADRVAGVRTSEGEAVGADAVVLATGPFDAELTREAGTRLPVQPGKGYHRDYAVGAGGAPPLRVACVLSERSVFCTPMGGFVRFAGTMELSGLNHVMRRPRLEQLTEAGRTCFPELGYCDPISEWCGLRPMASDGLPIIGPLDGVEGLSVATGHGMLGLTLGPVTGQMIAKHVLGEREPRLEAFSPSRFR